MNKGAFITPITTETTVVSNHPITCIETSITKNILTQTNNYVEVTTIKATDNTTE